MEGGGAGKVGGVETKVKTSQPSTRHLTIRLQQSSVGDNGTEAGKAGMARSGRVSPVRERNLGCVLQAVLNQ